MEVQQATKPGLYIGIEGINGCGKTEMVRRIRQYLVNMEIPVSTTRQPGGSVFGGALRAVMENIFTRPDDKLATLFCMAADRAENTASIMPKLDAGQWIISDRCAMSTYVYQEYEGTDIDLIDAVNCITSYRIPDYVFWIDVDPALSLERIKEQEKLEGRKKKISQPQTLEEVTKLAGLYQKHYFEGSGGHKFVYVPNPNKVWSIETTFNYIRKKLDKIVYEWKGYASQTFTETETINGKAGYVLDRVEWIEKKATYKNVLTGESHSVGWENPASFTAGIAAGITPLSIDWARSSETETE